MGDATLVDGETTEGSVLTDESVTIGELVLATCEVGGDKSLAIGGIKAPLDCTKAIAII